MISLVDGYLAIVLNDQSQAELLRRFPPLYPKVFAHHITVVFKPDIETFQKYEKYIGSKVNITVTGYAKDEKGEAIVVETDILKDQKSHITISTNGVPPIYSKTLLQNGYEALSEPFHLHGQFVFIDHQKMRS